MNDMENENVTSAIHTRMYKSVYICYIKVTFALYCNLFYMPFLALLLLFCTFSILVCKRKHHFSQCFRTSEFIFSLYITFKILNGINICLLAFEFQNHIVNSKSNNMPNSSSIFKFNIYRKKKRKKYPKPTNNSIIAEEKEEKNMHKTNT